MRTIILVLGILLGLAGVAWAFCTTETVIVNGKLVVCTRCCDDFGRNCTTVCF